MKRSKKVTIAIVIFFLVITLIIVGRYGVGLYFKKKFSKRPPPGVIVEVVEAKNTTAVFAFGRFNPPTAGHKKLVDTIKAQNGDHYLFLGPTKTNRKQDPLTHEQKVTYATAMFPGVKIGDASIRTWVDAMKYLQSRGYKSILYVAGSDRVEQFNKLLNTYDNHVFIF